MSFKSDFAYRRRVFGANVRLLLTYLTEATADSICLPPPPPPPPPFMRNGYGCIQLLKSVEQSGRDQRRWVLNPNVTKRDEMPRNEMFRYTGYQM